MITPIFSQYFSTHSICFFKAHGQVVQRHEKAEQGDIVQKLCRTLKKASLNAIFDTPTSCTHVADLDLGSRQGIVWLETVTLVFTHTAPLG